MIVQEDPGNWAFTLIEVADRNGFLSTPSSKKMSCAQVDTCLLTESDLPCSTPSLDNLIHLLAVESGTPSGLSISEAENPPSLTKEKRCSLHVSDLCPSFVSK